MTVTAIHLLIHGRVQNVGYRSWLEKTARAMGLSGWVRNLQSGNVEAVICGNNAEVAQLHRACERGPDDAHVTRVDVSIWSGETPVSFQQLDTPEAAA